jgi:L-asparaginase II
VAIIPEKQIGIAIKIEDGNSRASEAVLVALLAKLGVLNPAHPAAQKRLPAPQINWRGLNTGELRIAQSFS